VEINPQGTPPFYATRRTPDLTLTPDYAITYDSGDGHFRQAVGYEVYHDLKTQGVLTPQDVQHLTAMAAKRHAEQVASVK
ncbi:MAG: hypothetical protein ACREP0_09950, partial [Rhodanobacteraceae bacterium]